MPRAGGELTLQDHDERELFELLFPVLSPILEDGDSVRCNLELPRSSWETCKNA